MRGFSVASLAFQRGSAGPAAYIQLFVGLFGREAASNLLPEVIDLLPERSKRSALRDAWSTSGLAG